MSSISTDQQTAAAWGAQAGTAVTATPSSSSVFGRTFGCEFELPATMSREALIQRIKARGHRIEEGTRAYTHDVTKGWKVVTDGSLTNGLELVSPIFNNYGGLAEVMKMCETLDQLNIEIDPAVKQFGFHIHIGATDLDGEAVAQLICFHHHIEEQGLLYCVAPSRRDSRWCKKTDERILQKARNGPITFAEARNINNDRYVALNMFERCATYGTVEFRRHGGTLEGEKAVAWILHGLCMVSASASKQVGRTGGQGLEACFRAMGMFSNGKLCEWAAQFLVARHRHFKGRRRDGNHAVVEFPPFPAKAQFLQIRTRGV